MYICELGLPGWVTAVEDEPQLVTVTFFGNVDAKLFDELTRVDPNGPLPTNDPRGGLAVARERLTTLRMTAKPAASLKAKIPIEPGGSGIQIKLKMDMMLEGCRPRRIVRFYPPTWKVNALPKKEEFFGRE